MHDFAEYAQYLQHPLTLVGFVLLLFFGVHRALLRSGVLPPLTESSGSRVVHALLRYGFIIALMIILLGFALEAYKTAHKGSTPEENAKVIAKTTNWFLLTDEQKDAATLNAISERDRQNAAGDVREIEDVLHRSGMKLTPEQLTGLGYAYLVSNEMDKAKTAFLDALQGNPSLTEANVLLSTVNQLQANELIVQGKLGEARKALDAAKGYAQAALYNHYGDTGLGDQLGFVYKDMAQRDIAANDPVSANQDLESAQSLFQQGLGVKANDVSALNGLGGVYYVRSVSLGTNELDAAIKAQLAALKIVPQYTFAWHDLAGALWEKYQREKPPNPTTLFQTRDALDMMFQLQTSGAQPPIPPANLREMQSIRAEVGAEIAKLPKGGLTENAASHFQVSGVGTGKQLQVIKNALVQYYGYLRGLGVTIPAGSVKVQVTPANDLYQSSQDYLSFYDPLTDKIFFKVQYADHTFWPLRDYTFRALGVARIPQRPALIAILSGLATYYPSSSTNNPNYGQDFAAHLDQFRSLDGIQNVQARNASPDGSARWGSAFWELRSLLNRESADALLLLAWQQTLSADTDQPDSIAFASRIIDLHKAAGGDKGDAIRQLFQRRGLKL